MTRAARTLTALDTLALRTRQGDVAATEQFLVALHAQVEAAVALRSRRMGPRGPAADVCADLTQDLVIELWQTDLPRWDPTRSAFLTFARMRMMWHVASWMRAQSRYMDDDAALYELPCDGLDPEALMHSAHRDRQVRALTRIIDERLTKQERAVVKQVDLEERSLTAFSKKKHVHVSGACRLRQRAHARIAREMQALAA
jgi:RNA polymerase sigma factor (sigma-70 family)